MATVLMGTGIALLVVGVVCLLLAHNEERTPTEKRRLGLTAVVVDLVAAAIFLGVAFG